MPPDLATLAEASFDAREASDNGTPPEPDAAGGQQPPADNGDTPPVNDNPNGDGDGQDDEQGHDSQANGDQGEGAQEDEEQGAGDAPADKQPKGNEAPKELTDDELLALARERGLPVGEEKKEEKKQDDSPREIVRPQEIDESTWGKMDNINRFIYDKLPYLTVRGEDGTEHRVKTREQLPGGDNFKYASQEERERFNDALTVQVNKAEKMHGDIVANIQQHQQQQAAQQRAQDTINDVERLQKEGVLPKINAKPGTPEFANEDGVKLANEIIQFQAKLEAEGEKISIYRAGKLFKAENPDKFAPPKPTTSSADDERKKISKNISGNGRGSQSQAKKASDTRPKFPTGMSAADIADYYGDQLD